MMLIVTPAWGARCVELFTGPVLDAHSAAIKFSGMTQGVRYLVHTDQPERVRAAIHAKTWCEPLLRTVPGDGNFKSFEACSREGLHAAAPGETVVLLNADMLISVETFSAIQDRIAKGKKLIVAASPRTLPQTVPTVGMHGRELAEWSLNNLHPIMRHLFWPDGKTMFPYNVFFERGNAVALRGFHLHPLAVVKDRKLSFTRSTDWDLANNYDATEIHVVQTPDELALAEISPAAKECRVGDAPCNIENVITFAQRKATDRHRFFFNHRIMLRGNPVDFGDEQLVAMLNPRRT